VNRYSDTPFSDLLLRFARTYFRTNEVRSESMQRGSAHVYASRARTANREGLNSPRVNWISGRPRPRANGLTSL
jgi:hypothetical protein